MLAAKIGIFQSIVKSLSEDSADVTIPLIPFICGQSLVLALRELNSLLVLLAGELLVEDGLELGAHFVDFRRGDLPKEWEV